MPGVTEHNGIQVGTSPFSGTTSFKGGSRWCITPGWGSLEALGERHPPVYLPKVLLWSQRMGSASGQEELGYCWEVGVGSPQCSEFGPHGFKHFLGCLPSE